MASIVARGRAAFDDDIALRRAVERCLAILGEAAKSLDVDVRSAIPEVPWRELIRLRDRLSHHYRIEAEELWATAHVDVPRLLEAVVSWRARGSRP